MLDRFKSLQIFIGNFFVIFFFFLDRKNFHGTRTNELFWNCLKRKRNKTGLQPVSTYRKDIEHLYHAFISGTYPLPAMHSMLVTSEARNIFCSGIITHIVVGNLCKNVRQFYLKFLGGGFNQTLSIIFCHLSLYLLAHGLTKSGR